MTDIKRAHNFIDLTGHVFHRLTAVQIDTASHKDRLQWQCRCSCGNLCSISRSNLTSGHTKSCGCLLLEMRGQHSITHGEIVKHKPSPELRSFQSAKARCNNPNDLAYDRYGKRGIEFRFTSFEEFLNELGRKPTKKHTLDRIETNGHYEVGNVKWSTYLEQNRNKRNNLCLTHNNETLTESEWCSRIGVRTGVITARLNRQWCIPCAVTIMNGQGTCHHKPPVDRWIMRRLKAS